MLRFSQWKGNFYGQELATTPAELEQVLLPLADAGVDIFDASMRRFWLPEFDGSTLNLAGWAKKITGKPAVAVGSVGLQDPLEPARLNEQSVSRATVENLSLLIKMLERDEFDLVAIGRILLANPSWPRIVAEGALDGLRPYDPDRVGRLIEPSEGAS
jgi:2,4-dienoyl-CoA reductase-like NADH-dependent reductase (Old Yellow Enzyme family)